MKRNFVYVSKSFDGYRNLAVDEWFLDHVKEDDLILHLYQNEDAVIIGKNQNPWVECNLEKMKKDGVQLVRRVTGGGAVYHDMGNLNFSFIAGKNRYDQEAQLNLILGAVKEMGIPCQFSGRNDLVSDGKKFSGNAFAARRDRRQHHGTLLISSDLTKLSGYLSVDAAKLRSKGIASVRSRVINLSEMRADLTVKDARRALLLEFEKMGYFAEWLFSAREEEEVSRYRERHMSDAWRLGQTPKFDLEWKERLAWGGVQLCLSFEKGVTTRVKAYSDAMDIRICPDLEERLLGLPYEDGAIHQALLASDLEEVRSLARFSFAK